METRRETYTIYSDGGYSVATASGGCAFVVLRDGELIMEGSARIRHASSQRAELEAVLLAIWEIPERSDVHIIMDSRYAMQVLDAARPPHFTRKNMDLIRRFFEIKGQRRLGVTFEWIRSHTGDSWNEYCDRLCTEAQQQERPFVLHKYVTNALNKATKTTDNERKSNEL
ncbi:MAG: hypothetical protein IJU63_05510 [Bacteroidales bacterium]|nr:hypothetical protein [Bacteroidales bacterium]